MNNIILSRFKKFERNLRKLESQFNSEIEKTHDINLLDDTLQIAKSYKRNEVFKPRLKSDLEQFKSVSFKNRGKKKSEEADSDLLDQRLMVELYRKKTIAKHIEIVKDQITSKSIKKKDYVKVYKKQIVLLSDILCEVQDQHTQLIGELVEEKQSTVAKNEEIKKLLTQIKENQLSHDTLQSQVGELTDEREQLLANSIVKDKEIVELSTKLALIASQKEHLIEEIDFQRAKLDSYKDIANRLESKNTEIRNSLSYRLGFGITGPLRWMYDLAIGVGRMRPSDMRNPFQFTNQLKELEVANTQLRLLEIDTRISPTSQLNQMQSITRLPAEQKDQKLSEDSLINQKDVSSRHKVLYVSPHLPDYDTSSGGKRATRMIELLAQELDVYVWTAGQRPTRHIEKLSSVGAIVINNNNLERLKRRIPCFHTIIFAWYYTIHDHGRLLELYPDARVIADTVDVHWVRESRSIGLLDGLSEDSILENKKREIAAYHKADVIWAVTDQDKSEIMIEMPESDVRIVSNIHDNHIHSFHDNRQNTMLFFGGFGHYPNISAAKIAATQILPLVRSEVPDAKLIIAGSKSPDEIKALDNVEGVEFRGFIEESDIESLYNESFLAIAPLVAGAGIKGKICEAIAYRTPVVTTDIGNEGIALKDEISGFVSNSPAEMAESIIKCFRRGYNLNQITDVAQKTLSNLVNSEVVKSSMLKSIFTEVSICIVTWNRKDLVERCIQSIEGNTKYPYYKILVHSNGCTDGTQEYLTAAAKINPRIIPILSSQNDVFVKPNNAMMKMYPDNDVVLINNDVYVTDGWLTALVDTAYSTEQIGIVGSKILYPDGTLQEFGSELYEDGTGRNIGKWDDPNKEEYSKLTRVGYVSGCSLYIKKSTIRRVGVFDEQFHPCYCEDSDYCYSSWEQGLQTVVTPHSIIYHEEGGTSGTDETSGFKSYQTVNFEKFLNKHKSRLGEIKEQIAKLN